MIPSSLRSWWRDRRRRNLAAALRREFASPAASRDRRLQILVISHDAYPAGAQQVLLSLLTQWKQRRTFDVKVICVSGGALRERFEQLFPTLFLDDCPEGRRQDRRFLEFVRDSCELIYSNSVVNGPLLGLLRGTGAPVITHCHELQASIERWAPGSIMVDTLTNSDFIISASTTIADNLRTRHQEPAQRLAVIRAFIDYWTGDAVPDADERLRLRTELGLAVDDIVVFGCGTTDWRKGPDLFVAAAIAACRQNPRLQFVWIGGDESPPALVEIARAGGCGDRVRFLGKRPEARRYFYAGDIFALTSREDPCALVALEAANAQLPVVCFAGAGDIPEVLGPESGDVVPFEDTRAFALSLLRLAADPEGRAAAGRNGNERVKRNHTAQASVEQIEEVVGQVLIGRRSELGRSADAPLVSVIIPNYNHQRYLPQRLHSVAAQTLRDIEIIVLDDMSTDESRPLLEAFVQDEPRARLEVNEANSGSTFKQWRKGFRLARGKYIWIAESDDFADPQFLALAVAQLEADSAVVVAHAHSQTVDLDGKRMGRPDGWLNDLAPGRWNSSFKVDGIAEIRDFLIRKNTVPNASAVVFRNFPGIDYLVDDGMRLCADWLFWIRMLARGRYAFIAKDLNFWRQHSSNARTRPPGVLEWQEGQRVLAQAAAILGMDPVARAQMLDSFYQRCMQWSGGSLDT